MRVISISKEVGWLMVFEWYASRLEILTESGCQILNIVVGQKYSKGNPFGSKTFVFITENIIA